MSTSAPFDAGIPVLTEVLQEVAPAPAPSPAPTPVKPAVWRTGTAAAVPISVLAPPPEIDLPVSAEPGETAAAPAAPAIDLDALEQGILAQLMPRVDALVAERIEQVLQGLAAELRTGLGESIGQAVAAAVRQELASRQAQKE